jgi:AcrR family transcriptional regulator
MAEEVRRSSLSGRRAEAQRNDGRILDAARAVFLADPEAPIAKVAVHAGVGVSALYRRYPSKEHLLRALAEDGLNRYVADLETALASPDAPWDTYAACLERVVDGQSQALAQRLAGKFTPTPELAALAKRAGRLAETLFHRVRRSGELRDDISEADVTLLLEMIAFIDLPGADGGAALRRRYLALFLHALHAPSEAPLPGRPARQADLAARWRTGGSP